MFINFVIFFSNYNFYFVKLRKNISCCTLQLLINVNFYIDIRQNLLLLWKNLIMIQKRDTKLIYLNTNKRYVWCSCGRTERLPFCDGTHKGSGYIPLIFEIKEAKE